MRSLVINVVMCLVVLTGAAWAEEVTLSWAGDSTTLFDVIEDSAHITLFVTPEWDTALCSQLEFYSKRFGDPGDLYCNVVVFGPIEGQSTMYGHYDGCYTVLTRQLFKLTDVSEEPSWFVVDIDPIELPPEFGVVLFTYSDDERGLLLGLSDPTGSKSHSGEYTAGKTVTEPDEENMVWWTTSERFFTRGDEREWLVRAHISSTISPEAAVDSSELIGSNVAYYDDGKAESFHTSQRHGPLVRIDGTENRTVICAYVYAKLDGDWFEAGQSASVYLLDENLRILQRKKLPYSNYATEPTWSRIEFDRIAVTPVHFVLVEPVSRPAVQMLIGCDTSGENQASLWGTAGSILDWGSDAPEESANWMIRLQYE